MGNSGRADRKHRLKNRTSPTRNQPQPLAYKIALRWLYPKDKTAHYFVNTDKRLAIGYLQAVAEKLAAHYGMKVWVYDSLLGFEVYLENAVSWEQVEEATTKVLGDQSG